MSSDDLQQDFSKEPVVIDINHLVKEYKLFKNDKQRLIDLFLPASFSRKRAKKQHEKQQQVKSEIDSKYQDFKPTYTIKKATNDITLQIRKGESVALIGENGAGKSTILKMITGVVYPTSGTCKVTGRVSALLELTAGFDVEFTGRDNIYLKAMLLGIPKKEIAVVEEDIVEFSNLGEYIDQPVRTYSSGMKARLGFAVIAFTEPDILVIDEALSVGDKKFQEKCRQKIDEIRCREDVTVLFVTHSLATAEEFCERGIVLEKGKLLFDGPIADAVEFYDNH
ncbi:MAG: ABC transporter ATP-binding protein [Candidatus Ancillula sp.]|jgi:teichoic acid transport system ATP-binding protein|nr:ABC transporter ATP-binding protein [Candidatus Ancillula sp.]